MKADGIEYEERMELLEEVTYPKPLAELLEAAYEMYRRGHPWVADYELSPKSVVRDMYERAMTFAEYVSFYGAGPLRRAGAALPRRRVQGAAADRPRGRQDRGADRPDRVAGRAGPPGRLQPASTSGSGCATPPSERREPTRSSTSARRRSPATCARSGCWCATPCSAGSSWPRCAATTSWASWTRSPAGTPTRWAEALEPYFAEHDEIGTGPGRARPGAAHDRAGPGPVDGPPDLRRPGGRPRLGHQRRGRPGRPPTRRARRSSASPTSARCRPDHQCPVRAGRPGGDGG